MRERDAELKKAERTGDEIEVARARESVDEAELCYIACMTGAKLE